MESPVHLDRTAELGHRLSSICIQLALPHTSITGWQWGIPTQVKLGYTTLIPKEVGTTEAEKMRPITVTTTLVRLFHRILARRLERHLPSSALQRGFKAGDGCGSNKRLLEAIIHERIGNKGEKPIKVNVHVEIIQ